MTADPHIIWNVALGVWAAVAAYAVIGFVGQLIISFILQIWDNRR